MKILFLLLISGLNIYAQNFEPAIGKSSLPNPVIHTIDEVKAYLSDPISADGVEIYKSEPSLTSPYAAGALQSEYIELGVRTVNEFRYIAGLNDDVIQDETWNESAQYGAALLAIINKGLNHTPAEPKNIKLPAGFYKKGYAGTSSSNLHLGVADIIESVFGYMDDSDNTNIDRLGHRRWVLNPKMSQAGFGQAGEYFSLKVFGDKSKPAPDLAYVAWPPVGPLPINYFGPKQAWSFSLNPAAFSLGIPVTNLIAVTLTRKRDGKAWNFSYKGSDGYFNINTGGFGLPFCIIFQPKGISSFIENDEFEVQIFGVKDGLGAKIPIKYITKFFGTGPEITPVIQSKKPSSMQITASSISKGRSEEFVKAGRNQITMGYVNLILKSFTYYIDSPEGILPIGIEINHDGIIHQPGEKIVAEKITAFRLISPSISLKYTYYTKKQDWGKWLKVGEWAEFPTGEALEVISIILE